MTESVLQLSEEAPRLAAARRGDRSAFDGLAEPYRPELRLHAYRMLGSLHDAEDAVQETLLRAWRSLRTFDERSSFRAWLYRIATNVCLSALSAGRSARRVLPDSVAPPSDRLPAGAPVDLPWLEPYPDAALEGVPDRGPGPDACYELRESVHLAFVAAIQLLPPRQRAALLLHDVLGWSAAEGARLLETTVASVNSALQRARATLRQKLPAGPGDVPAAPEGDRRALLERYIRCWETADVGGFVSLLREDAVLTMPPWRDWYRGRDALGRFLAMANRPGGPGPFRLLSTAANRQPAFAFYNRGAGDRWRPHSIAVLTLSGGAIAAMTSFVWPELFRWFGLPEVLAE